MVNTWPIPEKQADTRDGRYYSFAFADGMPKLNTNNEEVIDYFCGSAGTGLQITILMAYGLT